MPQPELTVPPRRLLRRRLTLLSAVIALCVSVALAVPQFASAAASHNPIGRLDAVAFINGQVHASGWALDPDTGASIRVWVYIDSGPSGITADVPRADVARAYPKFGAAHGFRLTKTVANGTHRVCAYGINVGSGANTLLGCRTVAVNNNPMGAVASISRVPGGLRITGFAADANATGAISVDVYIDSQRFRILAALPNAAAAARWPALGSMHGYDFTHAVANGTHRICVNGVNVGIGVSTVLGCATTVVSPNPIGHVRAITRVNATTMAVSGWALDPDTASPTSVQVSVDGTAIGTVPANVPWSEISRVYPAYGPGHSFNKTFTVTAAEHTVCAIAVNIPSGTNVSLGCGDLPAQNATAPGAPASIQAWPGSSAAIVGWSTPSNNGGAAITGYVVTASPGGRTASFGTTVRQATIAGLTNGTKYTLTVAARNLEGVGTAARSAVIAPSPIPPQLTPAPVSTSHYVRNITGSAVADAALMKRTGTIDAGYNPSGHRYLVLLQIGGQDESRKGVLLSATSRFVSYAGVVNAMKAYLDGYASRQKAYAPMTLAIGTNNDIDVSVGAGDSWARNVINPVLSYAARYPGITVGGADDMEPGFSGTAAQTEAWLTGYLRATSAKFVFNGSADGCSTSTAGRACNNRWTMADLQWLSGGASAARILSLPQIYNTAMPLQWKYISMTGTNARRSRINFGGPLTEATACAQTRSCGSMSNVVAWRQLWSAISSAAATRQYDMPHGTDLRIN